MTGEPPPERIMLLHARYAQPGGEEAVVEAEAALLRAKGHLVEQLTFDNATWASAASPLARARQALETVWSRHAESLVRQRIRRVSPDLVHVHNTFPSASPAVYRAARRTGLPVVKSLHNYRLMCPAGTFFRDGHACTDCLGRRVPWPGAIHACYRDSVAASAVVGSMLTFHNVRGTWQEDIDHYICETEFARDLFVAGGLPPDRITIKPNFLEPDPDPHAGAPRQRRGFLFAGRLSAEKGIDTLLEAARAMPGRIRVVGTGPLHEDVSRAAAAGRVIASGYLASGELQQAMREATALLLPSHAFEGFPMTVIEAFAHGLPVIASATGGLPAIVGDGRNGLLVPVADPDALAQRIAWAEAHPTEMARMGLSARRAFETQYSGDRNYEVLMRVYSAARARVGRRGAAK